MNENDDTQPPVVAERARPNESDPLSALLPPGQQPSGSPSAIDHLIPAKNPPALIGYYVGVASLIPCFALLAGPAALVLGLMGLKAVRQVPQTPGKAHSIVAIVLGALTTLLNLGAIVLMVVNARPSAT